MTHLVRISDDLYKQIETLAENEDRSVTNMIALLLKKAIDIQTRNLWVRVHRVHTRQAYGTQRSGSIHQLVSPVQTYKCDLV